MLERAWPAEGATRVPYWVYQDEEVYREEQRRIFRGPTWSYLCLEAEIPQPKDFVTTFVGDMPVVVARDPGGVVHAWENRCAHRGALVCMQRRGSAERFSCIYHNWTYDHAGNLTHVAFRNGIAGKGGMPADANPESQSPKQLRVESIGGLVNLSIWTILFANTLAQDRQGACPATGIILVPLPISLPGNLPLNFVQLFFHPGQLKH